MMKTFLFAILFIASISQLQAQGEIADVSSIRSVTVKAPASKAVNTVYLFTDPKLDKTPEFPGGKAAMERFVKETRVYPSNPSKSKKEKNVVVRFIVTETGEIDQLKVIKSDDHTLDMEAIHIVQAMPNWIPAESGNEPVPVYTIIPIRF